MGGGCIDPNLGVGNTAERKKERGLLPGEKGVINELTEVLKKRRAKIKSAIAGRWQRERTVSIKTSGGYIDRIREKRLLIKRVQKKKRTGDHPTQEEENRRLAAEGKVRIGTIRSKNGKVNGLVKPKKGTTHSD